MAETESSKTNEVEAEQEQSPAATVRQTHVPAEIRNVSFPVSVRGYDRHAVEVYVQRVNRVIAELEVTRSPQAAVRHAVDRVSEQTKGILQQARESAEQITAAAREEADQILAAAKAEAAELVVNASSEADRLGTEAQQLLAQRQVEGDDIVARANADADERRRLSNEELAALEAEAQARMRELQADTETVWKERQALLEDIDGMAARLQQAASAAAARFSREEAGEPVQEAADETVAELESRETLVKTPSKSAKR
jgi:DivIVA domain-containing protein